MLPEWSQSYFSARVVRRELEEQGRDEDGERERCNRGAKYGQTALPEFSGVAAVRRASSFPSPHLLDDPLCIWIAEDDADDSSSTGNHLLLGPRLILHVGMASPRAALAALAHL